LDNPWAGLHCPPMVHQSVRTSYDPANVIAADSVQSLENRAL
jgi:hypothetical protein